MQISLLKIDKKLIMAEAERQYKFVIIYLKAGKVLIEIDNEKYEIKERKCLTITPKQYYRFIELTDEDGYVLEFVYDFFCKDEKSVELIYHNGLYCHFGLNEIINISGETGNVKIERYFKEIWEEQQDCKFEFESSIHSILKLLLIEISRHKIFQQQRPLYKPDAIFLKFLTIARDNFSKRLSIHDYASILNITEGKLNELCKKITGETTQQLINDLIILEAKRLMSYKKLTIKQVSYELGFTDSHYFSRFFKKQTSTRAKDHLRKNIAK